MRRIKMEELDSVMSEVTEILNTKGYNVVRSRLDREFPDRLAVLQYDTTILQQDDDGNKFYYMGLHNSVNIKCVLIPRDSIEYSSYMRKHPEVDLDKANKGIIKIINPFSTIAVDFLEKYDFDRLPSGFSLVLEKDALGNTLYSITTTVHYQFDHDKNNIYVKLNLMLRTLKKWAVELPVRNGHIATKTETIIDSNKMKLEKMIYKKAYKLYGKDLPTEISSRIKEELDALLHSDEYKGYNDSYKIYEYVARFVRELKKNNDIVVSYRGSLGSSFICYLLGITDIDPLKVHYKCNKCGKVEFIEDESFGVCLKPIKCACGDDMIGEGYDIPSYPYYGLSAEKSPVFEFNVGSKNRMKVVDIYKSIFKDCEDRLEADNKKIFKTTIHVGDANIDFYLHFIDNLDLLTSADQLNSELGKIDLNDSTVYKFLNGNSDEVMRFFKDVIRIDYKLFQKLEVIDFKDFIYAIGILHNVSNHNKVIDIIEESSRDIKSIIYSREELTNYLLDLDGNFDASDCYLTMNMELFEHIKFVSRFKDDIDDWVADFISNTTYMYPKAHVISYALMYYLMIYNEVYGSK